LKIIVEKSTKTITPIRERFRSKAEKPKRSEKLKIVSGNGPNMDDPPTTTISNLKIKGTRRDVTASYDALNAVCAKCSSL
jgi:hypothetical protein